MLALFKPVVMVLYKCPPLHLHLKILALVAMLEGGCSTRLVPKPIYTFK